MLERRNFELCGFRVYGNNLGWVWDYGEVVYELNGGSFFYH